MVVVSMADPQGAHFNVTCDPAWFQGDISAVGGRVVVVSLADPQGAHFNVTCYLLGFRERSRL